MLLPRKALAAGVLVIGTLVGSTSARGDVTRAEAPLACSRGASEQRFSVSVTAPAKVVPGAIVTVRLDAASSGAVSQIGLNFIHALVTDYVIPTGSTYVEGSARLVPDTGSDNVRAGATVTQSGGLVRLTLPGHVVNGSAYTPPSVELRVVVVAAPGETMVVGFSQLRLKANAVLLGDLDIVCNPRPRPFPLAKIRVTAS